MKTPLPFIQEIEGKLVLNEEVMSIIKNSNNPKFISFYGSTRGGKSTTLNQLIHSNIESWSYIRKDPFKTGSSVNSVTSGCDIYGPIKFSELKKKHPLSKIDSNIKEDFDVFFCDTEGIASLNNFNKASIPGILIILQICTISIFMVDKNCKEPDFKEIVSLMQFSKILNKELKLFPRVGVYISNMLTEEENIEIDENDEYDYNGYKQLYKEYYQNSISEQRNMILNRAKERYPDLDFKSKDIEIIAGGPYVNEKDPKKDIKLQFYWCSIHEIFNSFLKFYREEKKERSKDGNNEKCFDIEYLIRTLFEIFSEIDKIDDDFNLRTFLINYLEKKFDNYSKKQFNIKLEKIKQDIKSNFVEYVEILNNDEKAKESIYECFEKQFFQIYNQLIPKKVHNFVELSLEQYRKYIKEQIDEQFQSICENILLPENIESLIKDVKEKIINAEFLEDVDMNQINNSEYFWNIMYQKNEIILNYFKETKENILNNLKENFLSEINKIFQNLLSQKKLWSNYLKDTLITIQKDINKKYSEMFKNCNYQEDIEKYIMPDDTLFSSIFSQIKENYFNSLSENRLKEVEENVKKICKEEYEKILENKLPVYENIKNDIVSRIKEIIESYLVKIFKGVEFKDQIEPNLGMKNAIENIIPLEIKNNSQIKGDKKDEILNIIEIEVENGVNIFNNKREKLPLFCEFLENIKKICVDIIDNKMKEIINSFYYLEEKIIFNSDAIFSLLTGDQKIYKNCLTKVEEVNIKLREICNDKSKEYDLLVQKTKPEWNKIKSDKILIINEICSSFINKIFSNANYQDDIKDINLESLKKSIIEYNGFFEGVQENKKNELISEIDKIISQTEDKILSKKNSLQNWNTIKTQLLQKAYIEMTNKSKTNLNTKELSKIIEILVLHIQSIPKFFDECKTEQRKNELISEIKTNANPIAQDYIKRIEEEEKRKREEEERERAYRRQLEEAERRRIEAERRAEAERRKREEENRRRQEEEKRRRQEEENRRRRQEEENRRRQEEERRRREEEERRRQEHRNHIEDLARRTIRGEFGNGGVRRQRLGGLYNEVQNRVNEILGCKKRY